MTATQLTSGSIVVAKNDQNRSIKSQSRCRPRSEESEEAILPAPIQLLSEKPLRDISTEEITRRAGVGKATIYKWWPSKAYVLVLDLIYGPAIYRMIVRHAPLRDKLADEMVSILFGGLDRCPERSGIAGKTRHNHTIRNVSKLAQRTAVWLDYRRDSKCGLSKSR